MRILLIGSNGQVGSALVEVLTSDLVTPLTHADIEITDPASVRKALEQYRPETVINTAAYHRVDDCEAEPEKAFRVNATAVHQLALACNEIGATLVHFSTDYVFGGDRREPYQETARPAPLSIYGVSKLAGEHLVAATLPQHFIIRGCGLYGLGGNKSKGGNFVETMLRKANNGETIKVVDDQVLTPTHTPELARKVAELIHTNNYGLYHITCQGQCSWYEFAARIFELAGLKPDLHRTSSETFRTPAKRPSYSVLENANLRSLEMDDLKTWQEALEDYLRTSQQR